MRIKLTLKGKFVQFEDTTRMPFEVRKALIKGDTSSAAKVLKGKANFDKVELVDEGAEKKKAQEMDMSYFESQDYKDDLAWQKYQESVLKTRRDAFLKGKSIG